jgi:DNA repair protein RadD
MLLHASTRECQYCGKVFEFDSAPNIQGKASTLDVMATNKPQRVEPTQMAFSIHKKPGKPDSLRVDYYTGPLRIASEWVCLFHGGAAQARAEQWWSYHTNQPLPADIHQAIEMAEQKAMLPGYLFLQQEGKYTRIISRGAVEVAA